MRTSYGNGRARSGDWDLVSGPGIATNAITGVIYCHAASHNAATMISPNNGRPQAWKLWQAMNRRFPTIVSDQAGDSWATDAGLTAITACYNFLQSASNPYRAKSGKVLLVGTSMGFQVACAWALQNLSSVAGIAGIIPLTDVNDLYTRNWNGATAVIDAAYGGSYSQATYGPTKDPTVFAASLNVPIKLFYADDDPGVLPSTCTNFASIAPNCSLQSLGNIGGHDTEAAYPVALANGLVDFLSANA